VTSRLTLCMLFESIDSVHIPFIVWAYARLVYYMTNEVQSLGMRGSPTAVYVYMG